MSSSDLEALEVEVVAEPSYPVEELYVFDQDLNEVAKSVGALKARLKPGIYKIRSIAGRASAEKIFEVPPTPFQSPSPRSAPKLNLNILSPVFLGLKGKEASDPGSAFVTNLSTRFPEHQVGNGGGLLVVVRARNARQKEGLGAGLTLCDGLGKELRNLSWAMERSEDGATAACSLALNPGSYLLRLDRGDHPSVEQTIVVAHKWQTQIFILARAHDDSPAELDLDLSDAGILMAPLGEGFRSDRPEAAWVEVLRQALADRRYSGVPVAELKRAIGRARNGQDDPGNTKPGLDPMFGLYAAHLLAQSPAGDEALLRGLVDRLRVLIGDHPDVMALYLRLGVSIEGYAVSQAPMLRSSWNILMDRGDKLVLPGSYASRIVERLWGRGAWLSWRVPEKLTWSAPPAAPIELATLPAFVVGNAETLAQFTRAAEQLQTETLPASEQQLLKYLHNVARSSASAADLALEGSGVGGVRGLFLSFLAWIRAPWINSSARAEARRILDANEITQALGMPQVVLAQAIGDLFAKFNKKGLLSIERRGARTLADVLAEEFVALHPDGYLQDKTLDGIYRSVHALDHPRAALCLAGDGPRGAFFGLGILQGMARFGLLRQFHYLSGVSGGSYIGAWLSAWRYHAKDDDWVLNALAAEPHVSSQSADGQAVAGLLDFDDNGTNRRGFLSRGLWTQHGRHARNLLLTWLVYGPLFLAALSIPKVYLAFVVFCWDGDRLALWSIFATAMIVLFVALAKREASRIEQTANRSSEGILDVKEPLLLICICGILLCASVPVWLNSGWPELMGAAAAAGAALFGLSSIRVLAPQRSERPSSASWRWISTMIAGATGGLVFAATCKEVAEILYKPPPPGPEDIIQPEMGLAIAVVGLILLALILADILYLGLTSRLRGSERDRAWQAASIGSLSLILVVWAILAPLDFFGPAAAEASLPIVVAITGISGAVGGVSGALALALGFGSLEFSRWRRLIGMISIYVAEVAAVALLAILVVILSANADLIIRSLAAPMSGLSVAAAKLVAALLATALFCVLAVAAAYWIDLSAFSRHEVHRSKSMRRFLGVAAGPASSPPDSSLRDTHDLAMADIWSSTQPERARFLFPMFNMALDHLGDKSRQGSEPFTVTPLASGSALFGYRSSADYGASEGGITLGTAMVVSGASIDREIARHTTPLVALMFSLLGVRHGLWLGNPKSDAASRRAQPRLSFTPVVEEIFGRAPGDYVHVSSGDGFDPLGLYEMIRRRCRFIVVSDAGADSLENLGRVIRRVRVDFGVAIDMTDLELQRAPPPSVGACCALGYIRYPEGPGAAGILIYLRPELDGSEPLDVRGYAARHPAVFPRERVSARQFDEEGAESYRALGSHIIDMLFQRGHHTDGAPAAKAFSLMDLKQRVHDYLAARREYRMAQERELRH
ncbi:patatin-like phospholipase family protein [Bradyrhizobium sp. WSM2254]|uniref:patatin-like phospholipase family protein n=1 Tax=Bradyrhizobium sp. WSM2254 TaxID=1188263 RepID=UPI0003FD04B8|nr:patatin-like phospholipase family protein [Bradyrhizobium sp. WSM2254]